MAQQKYRSRERSSGYRRDSPKQYKRKREYEDHSFGNESGCNYDSHHAYNNHHHHHHHDDDKYNYKKSRRSDSPDSEEIPSWDDEERHYKIRVGENLIPRYKIMSLIGEGTFGRVVECWDRQTKKSVAIKIVRAIEKYRDAAKLEIEVLETLQQNDPDYTQPLIQMMNWFDYREHICMVFPKHGPSLYDFLVKNSFRPFSLPLVKEMGFQLLHSISYLHSLTLVHTDLKPENILFVHPDFDIIENPPSRSRHTGTEFSPMPLRVPRDGKIKLIDFGSATFNHRYHTTVVSTRHYRAPEIIMGMGWSYACDIWSVACILLQLYTGDTLFQTRENREHLAMMEKVLGHFPDSFVDKSDRHTRKYFKNGSVVFPSDDVTSSHERAKQLSYLKHMNKLSEYIAPEDDQLLDLLTLLFEYDPAKRITAKEALRHPFFNDVRHLYQYKDPREGVKEREREKEREKDRDRERERDRDRERERERESRSRESRGSRDGREYRGGGGYGEYPDEAYQEFRERDRDRERERERDVRDYRDYYSNNRDYRDVRDGRDREFYNNREHREYRDERGERGYRRVFREDEFREREREREREYHLREGRYDYRGR